MDHNIFVPLDEFQTEEGHLPIIVCSKCGAVIPNNGYTRGIHVIFHASLDEEKNGQS